MLLAPRLDSESRSSFTVVSDDSNYRAQLYAIVRPCVKTSRARVVQRYCLQRGSLSLTCPPPCVGYVGVLSFGHSARIGPCSTQAAPEIIQVLRCAAPEFFHIIAVAVVEAASRSEDDLLLPFTSCSRRQYKRAIDRFFLNHYFASGRMY